MPIPRSLILLLAAVPAFAQQPPSPAQANGAPPASAPAAAASSPASQPVTSAVPPQMQQAVAPVEASPEVNTSDRAEVYKGLITTLHESGENKAALAQIEAMPPNIAAQASFDPDFLVTSAGVYAAMGNNGYALRLLSAADGRYILKRQVVPLGLQIQECYLLLNMGDDAALHSRLLHVTQMAERNDTLNDDERNKLNNLWIYLALRRSTQEANAGNQRRALRILITASETYPESTLIKRALAGAFLNAGDAKTALQLYKEAGVNDSSPAEYKGAIGAAFAAGDRENSAKWLHALLEKSPKDPQVLTLAAKFEQALGHRKLAAGYYRAALANMPKEKRRLVIPATLRDEPSATVHTAPSPLTTLASVTDPSGATAPQGDTATTIASVPTAEMHNYGSPRLPGERFAPVLVPIFISQQSPVAAEATFEGDTPSLPVRATMQSLEPAKVPPSSRARPGLHHRGSSSASAGTPLDSFSPESGGGDRTSFRGFQSLANERLGEYDPSR